MGQIVRCITCDEIFVRTPYDHCPEYLEYHPESSSVVREVKKDDVGDFLKAHLGHQLEELDFIDDSFVSERSYSEPVKVSYWKATNGREQFVVKRFREKIHEPLKDALIAGDYVLKCVSIEIELRDVAKQLAAALKGRSLSEGKKKAFLQLLQQAAESVDITQLERVPEESNHPLETYYRMNEATLQILLNACRRIFNKKEYIQIETFIHDQKDDGVLLLKATYAIQIVRRLTEEKTSSPILQYEHDRL